MASLDIMILDGVIYEGAIPESVSRVEGAYEAAIDRQATTQDTPQSAAGVTFAALSEPLGFDLPPEVLAALAPGTDPFASLVPVGLPAAGPSGSPVAASPGPQSVAQAGSGGLVGLGGLVPAQTISPLNYQVQANAYVDPNGGHTIFDTSELSHLPMGQVFFESIRNRQPGGVRFGTLPMVVFQDR